MTSVASLIKYLADNSVEFRVHSHLPAFSAHDVAITTHVPDDTVAKTLLIKAGPLRWLAVVPAGYRIDQRLLHDALEQHSIHLVSEEELEQLFPNCEIGAMPPFGNLYGIPVIADKHLAEQEDFVFNACTHTESIRIKFSDFERLVKPMIAEISVPRDTHHEQLTEH